MNVNVCQSVFIVYHLLLGVTYLLHCCMFYVICSCVDLVVSTCHVVGFRKTPLRTPICSEITFHKHVSMVAWSCSYAHAIRHIRLLSTELAQILAIVQHQLPQRSASWCTNQHHPEAAVSSEQRGSDCAPGVEAIPRQAVTTPAGLVASPAVDHIQVIW